MKPYAPQMFANTLLRLAWVVFWSSAVYFGMLVYDITRARPPGQNGPATGVFTSIELLLPAVWGVVIAASIGALGEIGLNLAALNRRQQEG